MKKTLFLLLIFFLICCSTGHADYLDIYSGRMITSPFIPDGSGGYTTSQNIAVTGTFTTSLSSSNSAQGNNEAFASGWNGDTAAPEKDDIYDYLHVLDADDDSSYADEGWLNIAWLNDTLAALTADDATPDVSAAATGINNFFQTDNANPTTYTDFNDTDDHSEFTNDKSWFWLRVDDANTTIDFSANANIEGNAGVDFTGSATQITYILFVFDDSRWNAVNFQQGFSSPTALGIASIDLQSGTIQGAMKVGDADVNGEVLTASTMNSIRISSGAGDWTIPDVCDSATGYWVTVTANAAHVASLDLAGDEDLFILSSGTALDADDELDTAGGAWDSCTVTCVAQDKWLVTGELGTCADGGASD